MQSRVLTPTKIQNLSGSDAANRAYYDAFSEGYEDHRDGRDPGGYHDLVDSLEANFVRRFGEGAEVLEVGSGTGLVLRRIAAFANRAQGVDLSPRMLARARARGLDVVLGSATELPFPDATFDVTCSFKVLAHVRDVRAALREMARVTRPGGVVIAEFYNPRSLRGWIKRFGPARRVATDRDEGDVYTRFDAPERIRRDLCPPGCVFESARGIRITLPSAALLRVPILGKAWKAAEQSLSDTPLNVFAGFWVAAFRKV